MVQTQVVTKLLPTTYLKTEIIDNVSLPVDFGFPLLKNNFPI
jgi:hypothetical protein